MKTVTIINADGCATRTRNVDRCNAETHIKARDKFAAEAEILLAYDADESLADRDPIAWKWNDPVEDAKFLFDESEVEEVESIDPSLIVRLKVVWDEGSLAISKNQVDLMQGTDANERDFGYVAGEDGGFFFTWMPTLEETLESIEEDQQGGDGGLIEDEVREFLRSYLPTTSRGICFRENGIAESY